jgi:serine/threonine protein kinase
MGGGGSDRGTREWGAAAADDQDSISVTLPPELRDKFVGEREIGHGGQAAAVRAHRVEDEGQKVVLKIFRNASRFTEADPRPVYDTLPAEYFVQYVEPKFGDFNGRWWEVLEYLPDGDVKGVAEEQGGTLTSDQIEQLLAGVVEGIDHLHSLSPRIIHRDIKPENLLVRTREPMRVVLADFGLARLTELSHERHSGSHTAGYGAPEAVHGNTDPPLDWWSLGMTIAELAAGRHPYELPDGRLMNERAMEEAIATKPVPLDDITDPRLTLLLRGLLTQDPAHRWRAEEVRAWLAGGAPEVVAGSFATPASRAAVGFPFGDADYTDVAELGSALLADWSRTAELVTGKGLDRLVDWVEENAKDRSIDRVAQQYKQRGTSTDALIADIGVHLNPSANPIFMGEAVDMASLSNWASRMTASDNSKLESIIEKLYDSGALYSYRSLPGQSALGRLEAVWHEFCSQANAWFKQVPQAGSMSPERRAVFLRAAIEKVTGASE